MVCIVSIFFLWWNTSIFFTITLKNENVRLNRSLIQTIVDNIDNAKREYLKDNITDKFSSSWFESLDEKGKNEYISSLISVKRQLKDVRPPECKTKSFMKDSLPKASIVIIFCNEHLSFILRTVWSVLDKSADHPETVHEIILGIFLYNNLLFNNIFRELFRNKDLLMIYVLFIQWMILATEITFMEI